MLFVVGDYLFLLKTNWEHFLPKKPHLIGVSKQPNKVVFLENKIQENHDWIANSRNGLEGSITQHNLALQTPTWRQAGSPPHFQEQVGWRKRLPADRLTWEAGRCSCTVVPGRGTVPSSLSEHWGGLIFLSLCLLNQFLFDFTFVRFHMSFLEPKEDYLLTHTPIFWHTSPFWFELPRFWSVNYTLHCFYRDTPRDKISRCHFNQRTSEKSSVQITWV